MAKNPTQWLPPSRNGSITLISNLLFQDNLGNSIVDNIQNNLVTTTVKLVPRPNTAWTQG